MRTGKLLEGAVVVAAVVVAAVVVAAVVVAALVVVVVTTGEEVLVEKPALVVLLVIAGRVVVVWTESPVVDQMVVIELMTDVWSTVAEVVASVVSEPEADVPVGSEYEVTGGVTSVLSVSEGKPEVLVDSVVEVWLCSPVCTAVAEVTAVEEALSVVEE